MNSCPVRVCEYNVDVSFVGYRFGRLNLALRVVRFRLGLAAERVDQVRERLAEKVLLVSRCLALQEVGVVDAEAGGEPLLAQAGYMTQYMESGGKRHNCSPCSGRLETHKGCRWFSTRRPYSMSLERCWRRPWRAGRCCGGQHGRSEERELRQCEEDRGGNGRLDQHDLRPLEYGAAGRLLVAGEIEDVLPLDDADLLDKVKPITPSGVKFDPEKLKARQDAQVRAVLDKSGFDLIVLGARFRPGAQAPLFADVGLLSAAETQDCSVPRVMTNGSWRICCEESCC